MDILLYVAITFVLLGLFGLWDESSVSETKINVDDVNVGDKIIIKGENFFVEGYSSNGVMEIYKYKDSINKEKYLVKFDKDVELLSHDVDKKRKYITVKGFKGTVGGDYLNKFKFE
jgi:hypothetical protein